MKNSEKPISEKVETSNIKLLNYHDKFRLGDLHVLRLPYDLEDQDKEDAVHYQNNEERSQEEEEEGEGTWLEEAPGRRGVRRGATTLNFRSLKEITFQDI